MPSRTYVTRTGRAVSPGTVTRRSYSYRRPQERPLPMWLQCHPKALTRTSRNPDCVTFDRRAAIARFKADGPKTPWGFRLGHGLSPTKDRALVLVEGVPYYTDDPVYAFVWSNWARHHGVSAELQYHPATSNV